ncbi:hypothetical protein B9479_005254 [Cryptococcus floricola]|uniref:Golgi apparatus membrane protein TVP38 n=1 Tax=Cryptococcus floricola TaxID=2591691 RepID=A0A5D3ATP9_9TREE|nr:hypothetical protein B9479_005254 [Cryptococcus floricola]
MHPPPRLTTPRPPTPRSVSATTTGTDTGPVMSFHPSSSSTSARPSLSISRENTPSPVAGRSVGGGPTPRTSMSHRPAFIHASTSYHSSLGGTSASHTAPHTPERRAGQEERYGSKESSVVYYPPDRNEHGAYPYPHQQFLPSSQLPSDGSQTTGALSAILGKLPAFVVDFVEGWRASLCSSSHGRGDADGQDGGGGLGKAMMWGWVATTIGFFLAIAFWRGQLFRALDDLSHYLANRGIFGPLTFYIMIFITTIPPLPLYSTLIVLSGYTFGVWRGFCVSYVASLSGAVCVFLVSRKTLKDTIVKSLAGSSISMSLLHVLPTHPHLLLLIRIAPYPYNLLNVILASSPTLTLQTYTGCTALALFKLVLHTWIGSGIHDLSKSYGHSQAEGGEGQEDGEGPEGQWPHHGSEGSGEDALPAQDGETAAAKTWTTWVGIVLCVTLFFYLTYFAKQAVKRAQEEQDRQEEGEREERQGLTCAEAGEAV